MRTIIEMAREAGMAGFDGVVHAAFQLEAFAALVRADATSGYAKKIEELIQERDALRALAQPEQEPWCMKMNDCKTKCEDCPDEPPQRQPEQEPVAWEQFHEHLVERNFCPRCGKRTADLTR
jgi:hypothetical protein